ncbi:MAG: hypothetical protein QXM48_06450 [Sulfolobales archaeon]
MRLLSRGLTKITASLALLIVMISTSVITWSLITAAGEQTYTVSQGTIRLEAVMYDPEKNELILNLRLTEGNYGHLNISLYRSRSNVELPCKLVINDVIYNKNLNLNILTIYLKLNEELTNGDYYLRLEVQNKLLGYKFSL